MKFHKLVSIIKNQRGVTLIELLIAVAITSVVTGSITMTMFQVYAGNARTSNHMMAVKQVQNAGYWFSRDALMAQTVILTADADGFPLTLHWAEWDTTTHQVTYDIVSDELKRTEGAIEFVVADYINSDPSKTKCEFIDSDGDGANDKLVLTVTATVGSGSHERSETRVYKAIPRAKL